MKLIDLLVKELPKRGGWPEGAERCRVGNFYGDSITVDFSFPKGYSDGFDVPFQYAVTIPTSARHGGKETDYCMITRDLYESALALSQKPAWNGEGVPPVGCECEISFYGKSLGQCEVLFVGDSLIVWKQKSSQQEVSGHHGHMNFRPLRTEAERKRDAAIEAIEWYMPEFITDTPNEFYHAKKIYDAIAAGKIPGVKLDD